MKGTRQKIMDAAMQLVIEKGYSDMTTIDIAKKAKVNEATLFRQFGTKKEIILAAMEDSHWLPILGESFWDRITFNLEQDLTVMMNLYFKRVTADIVKLSIGLRSPQIFAETAPLIKKVPVSYLNGLETYFSLMKERGNLKNGDIQGLALTFFTAMLGFAFLESSFDEVMIPLDHQSYIETTVRTFVAGIQS